MRLHPEANIQTHTFGEEHAPIVVIDNFVDDPGSLIEAATREDFTTTQRYFPGVRAEAPREYRRFLLGELQPLLFDVFELEGESLGFSMCHFSIVTTPPEQLMTLQRIPHVDTVQRNALASIHYLFTGDLGGTAFYRHRSTGFESVDESRRARYLVALESELEIDSNVPAAYIDGDTALFERIAVWHGMFNRLLVYRRNSLHSGSIAAGFPCDADPRTGRLSINTFIDVN